MFTSSYTPETLSIFRSWLINNFDKDGIVGRRLSSMTDYNVLELFNQFYPGGLAAYKVFEVDICFLAGVVDKLIGTAEHIAANALYNEVKSGNVDLKALITISCKAHKIDANAPYKIAWLHQCLFNLYKH